MYISVLVYDEAGNYLGRAIKKGEANRLKSINLYTESETNELNEELERLNVSVALYKDWPDARDPEVIEILSREDFYPVEMAEQEVLDEDASYLVYRKDRDQEVDPPEVDEGQSVLRYKKIMAPVRPSDVMERTKRAQEIIARQRAGHAR